MAILITLIAGLATVFGAAVFCFADKSGKKPDPMPYAMAFAAGLMLFVAIGEFFPEALEAVGFPLTLGCVAAGIAVSLILDKVAPHDHHDHDEHPGHTVCPDADHVSPGMIAALMLHNIVEGFATGITAQQSLSLGISIALSIALHNIPIGVSVAAAYHDDKKRAVLISLLIALVQPLGAALGLIYISLGGQGTALAYADAFIAGVLLFITFDEIIPSAFKSGKRTLCIVFLILGVAFMPLIELI